MTRVVSSAGRALIKAHEGLRLKAYPDPASGGDPYTIGYGHTKGVKPGDVITEEQADAFLAEDLAWVEQAINRLVTVPISQPQFDALASLVFNIGAGAFERSTLLRHLNDGDYMAAATQFARWVNAAGKKMPGLVKRRSDEAAKFRDGMNWPPHNVRAFTPAPPAPVPAPIVQPGPEPADYYAPSGEAPEWVPPPQEQTMILPALAKGLAAVVIEGFTPLVREKLTKEMGRHTDSPEAAGAVADAVIGAAKTVTGLADPVQAVAAVRADPALNQRAEADTLARLEQALPLLQRINDMEAANVKSAREFNASEPFMLDTPWVKLRFVHLLSLMFVGFSGVFVTTNWAALTAELKGAVITLMVIAGWNGVRDYWMGSSSGSAAKDAVIGEITRRR